VRLVELRDGVNRLSGAGCTESAAFRLACILVKMRIAPESGRHQTRKRSVEGDVVQPKGLQTIPCGNHDVPHAV